jgi:hypothetical protein
MTAMAANSVIGDFQASERRSSLKLPMRNPFTRVKDVSILSVKKNEVLDSPVLLEILAVLQKMNGRMQEQNLRLELIETTKLYDAMQEVQNPEPLVTEEALKYLRRNDAEYGNDYEKSIMNMKMRLENEYEADDTMSGKASMHQASPLPGFVQAKHFLPKRRDFDVYSLSVYTDADRLNSRFSLQEIPHDPSDPSTPSSSTDRSPNSDKAPSASSQSSCFSITDDECRPGSPDGYWNDIDIANPTAQTTLTTSRRENHLQESSTSQNEINPIQSLTITPLVTKLSAGPQNHPLHLPTPPSTPASFSGPDTSPLHPKAEICFYAYDTWKAGITSKIRAEFAVEERREEERHRCSLQQVSVSMEKKGSGWKIILTRVYCVLRRFRGREEAVHIGTIA